MLINCTYKKTKWEVEIKVLNINEGSYELMVSGRGLKYHIIVGKHAYGNYICIPSKGIGCELACLTDKFWNQESISRYIDPHDCATLVAAINELEYL